MQRYHMVLTLCLGCMCTMLASGCALTAKELNDPRNNPKVAYLEAHRTADRALEAGGYDINSYTPNYDLREFTQIRYFEETGKFHVERLYDFLKTTQQAGFPHFVVVFDHDTGEFFLRSDLRSYTNLSSLPKP